MANTITVGAAADAAVAILYERLGVTNLVHRDFSQALVTAKKGDTMNVRKPTTFEAKDFTHAAGITVQDVNEGSVPVKLNKIADVSFAITDTERTMKIDEFAKRLIAPAVEAIAQKIDRELIAHLIAAANGAPVGNGNDHKSLIEAGLRLNVAKVPLDNRHAVIDPYLEAAWREHDSIQHADKSGDTQALRQGSVGQNLHGFDVFWTQNVSPDPENTHRGVAFHRDMAAFTNAALEIPASAHAAIQSYNGLTLRVLEGFDINKKQTTFSVDCLYGVSTLDKNKGVALQGEAGGSGNP